MTCLRPMNGASQAWMFFVGINEKVCERKCDIQLDAIIEVGLHTCGMNHLNTQKLIISIDLISNTFIYDVVIVGMGAISNMPLLYITEIIYWWM